MAEVAAHMVYLYFVSKYFKILIFFSAEDQSVGGSIFYDFDEQDDWDEEDPDDDLDI